tara:strand:- start:71050 stop:71214 length:165 start_codon:yes stop_codon:yes gene_type:complete
VKKREWLFKFYGLPFIKKSEFLKIVVPVFSSKTKEKRHEIGVHKWNQDEFEQVL